MTEEQIKELQDKIVTLTEANDKLSKELEIEKLSNDKFQNAWKETWDKANEEEKKTVIKPFKF